MSRALLPAARAPSQGGSSASVSVGPNRETAGGVVRSRNASSLAIAAPANAVPASAVNATADGDPDAQPARPERGPGVQPAGEAETGEEARPRQREQPRIGGLERRHQASAIRARSSWLSTPPIDGSSSRSDPTPSATTIGYVSRPRATGGHTTPLIGDRERDEHRDPDDDVEWPTRPVGQQDQDRGQTPRRRRGRCRAAGVRVDGHACRVSLPMHRADRCSRRAHAASTTDHRTGGSSRPAVRRDEHAPTAPDRPERTVTASRGTCDMAGPVPRGSRGRGRSSRLASPRPRHAAASTVVRGSVGTASAPSPTKASGAHGGGPSRDRIDLPAAAHEGPRA